MYDNFAFLRVYEAGHMVPYDQPEHSLEFINTWIHGHEKKKPFKKHSTHHGKHGETHASGTNALFHEE